MLARRPGRELEADLLEICREYGVDWSEVRHDSRYGIADPLVNACKWEFVRRMWAAGHPPSRLADVLGVTHRNARRWFSILNAREAGQQPRRMAG